MHPKRTRICPVCGNPFSRKDENSKWFKTCSRSCGRRLAMGDPIDRFWSHIDRSAGSDACWPWLLTCTKEGYGRAGFEGRNQLTHRIAWQIANGPIPDGQHVLHRCDNRPCCNPAHLFLGTQTDNMGDMVAKGRSAQHAGADNGRSVLSEDDVRKIRVRYANTRVSQQRLADEYGVNQSTIGKIIQRKLWPHVSET